MKSLFFTDRNYYYFFKQLTRKGALAILISLRDNFNNIILTKFDLD